MCLFLAKLQHHKDTMHMIEESWLCFLAGGFVQNLEAPIIYHSFVGRIEEKNGIR